MQWKYSFIVALTSTSTTALSSLVGRRFDAVIVDLNGTLRTASRRRSGLCGLLRGWVRFDHPAPSLVVDVEDLGGEHEADRVSLAAVRVDAHVHVDTLRSFGKPGRIQPGHVSGVAARAADRL
jgi:hypothetical protein